MYSNHMVTVLSCPWLRMLLHKSQNCSQFYKPLPLNVFQPHGRCHVMPLTENVTPQKPKLQTILQTSPTECIPTTWPLSCHAPDWECRSTKAKTAVSFTNLSHWMYSNHMAAVFSWPWLRMSLHKSRNFSRFLQYATSMRAQYCRMSQAGSPWSPKPATLTKI